MIEVLFILQNFSVIIGRQKYIFFGLLLMHRVIGYTSFPTCSYDITYRIWVMGLATLTLIITQGSLSLTLIITPGLTSFTLG